MLRYAIEYENSNIAIEAAMALRRSRENYTAKAKSPERRSDNQDRERGGNDRKGNRNRFRPRNTEDTSYRITKNPDNANAIPVKVVSTGNNYDTGNGRRDGRASAQNPNYIAKPRFNPKIAHLACRTCGEKGHLAADHYANSAQMNALDAEDGRAEAEHEAPPESADNEKAAPEDVENDETYYLEAYEAHQGNTNDDDYSTDGGEVVFMNELLVSDDGAHNNGRDPAPFAAIADEEIKDINFPEEFEVAYEQHKASEEAQAKTPWGKRIPFPGPPTTPPSRAQEALSEEAIPRLRQQWQERISDITGDIPLEKPPYRERP
ncbi:hypothetical protein PUNSTDRAFT_131399 [Punctularia strigosozonata HHB-11173 SS5]|uniref:uncharacterized protein n=1 Tax=Punctularia strigosozonata (strain HHB-11173) TaxID=741275 RepID=UPI00044168D9|nr:uncharacterized protein PUNSTDRAFT_131399 [Punctularia strigosozonata HHB-11173 SS5]EIN11224.1 hypothetical protein PUNSTDRAFT_131399 [Punctularia strigosozonata HHB-11173 SS5]